MLSPSPAPLVASPCELPSLPHAETDASAFHLEWITDWERGFHLLQEHRLFKMDEAGWGLMRKAHVHADPSEFIPLLMILAWDPNRTRTRAVGVVLVERHRVYAPDHWLHQTWVGVLDVYVSPSHRRQGIARALVKQATQAFPWVCAHHNDDSRALYQEFGLQDAFALCDFMGEHFNYDRNSKALIQRDHRRYRAALRAVVKWPATNPYVEAEARRLLAESIKESKEAHSLTSH